MNSDVNKILDYFLIADHELENKDKLLKNIDNELDLSDEFPNTKKSNEEKNENKSDDEFVDVEEENNEENTKPKPEEKNSEEEIKKSMDILSLEENENDDAKENKDGNFI